MKAQTYIQRRKQLAAKYSRTLFVIYSGDEKMRSHSVAHRFKVASDFYYLTGLELSGAYLVLASDTSYLLSKAFSHEAAVWDDEAILNSEEQEFVQDVQKESVDKLADIVQSHLAQFDRLAFALGRNAQADDELLNSIAFEKRYRGRKLATPLAITDSRTLVGTLRLKKDDDEIANMREAGRRSSLVHHELMKLKIVGKTERQVANWIEAQFMLQDMSWTAYQTIVGSGERTVLLHARATDKVIKDNELVLIDAGAEWKGYCADITRTITAGSKFTQAQRELYDIVLKAHKDVISEVKEGLTLTQLHEHTLQVLSEGLARHGYNKDEVKNEVSSLMAHSTSHWIGLDVHDPSAYFDDLGQAIKLEQGMTFTVEPGLYFRSGFDKISKFKNMGVRIEDDILVTAKGHESFTKVAKEIEEIETLRSQQA
ncbi:Xaa-Pro peptidase family protein [Bdellovibrio sp. NC01]|uniref:M24 family metallopeptidase n=1 Tax=Bdellovibrio sp. NC01 TaxID=2220073 RepID=UPI001159420F|nr:Xaa-Pro peptidase family protein [Bdellovibrio sp. NC01]QDK36354.1 hypothetical protein DOE51_01435 [Bdellovibrio sp. NC01]